jgi:hypothetical protein
MNVVVGGATDLGERLVCVEVVVFPDGHHRHVDLERRLPKRIWFMHVPQLHEANPVSGVRVHS